MATLKSSHAGAFTSADTYAVALLAPTNKSEEPSVGIIKKDDFSRLNALQLPSTLVSSMSSGLCPSDHTFMKMITD